MGGRLVDGEFQADEDWCPPGYVPLKLTDKRARDLLWLYAERMKKTDPLFAEDLHQAILNSGYNPMKGLSS